MVKDHSDSEKGNSFRLTARVLLYAPSHRQDSTYHGLCYTSRGALAGSWLETSKWLHYSLSQDTVHCALYTWSPRKPVTLETTLTKTAFGSLMSSIPWTG